MSTQGYLTRSNISHTRSDIFHARSNISRTIYAQCIRYSYILNTMTPYGSTRAREYYDALWFYTRERIPGRLRVLHVRENTGTP